MILLNEIADQLFKYYLIIFCPYLTNVLQGGTRSLLCPYFGGMTLFITIMTIKK